MQNAVLSERTVTDLSLTTLGSIDIIGLLSGKGKFWQRYGDYTVMFFFSLKRLIKILQT